MENTSKEQSLFMHITNARVILDDLQESFANDSNTLLNCQKEEMIKQVIGDLKLALMLMKEAQ